jgi:hypothetical protein
MDEKVVSTSGTGTLTPETVLTAAYRDIFKNGASPELEAGWKEMEKAIALYPSLSSEDKKKLLEKYPDITHEVKCPECRRDF